MTAAQHNPWHRLRLLREDKGWSQNKLANKSGISRSHLNRLEVGARWPTHTIVLLLAEALEIPPKMIERRASESVR
jgi:transcriptional regulator with XRE-family HTH domain